jgi:hypothetical protein
MNHLLDLAIEAYGGLERWRDIESLHVTLSFSGFSLSFGRRAIQRVFTRRFEGTPGTSPARPIASDHEESRPSYLRS